jgi:hypothetical protein
MIITGPSGSRDFPGYFSDPETGDIMHLLAELRKTIEMGRLYVIPLRNLPTHFLRCTAMEHILLSVFTPHLIHRISISVSASPVLSVGTQQSLDCLPQPQIYSIKL